MKNDENIEEYFLSVIREREKEDAANELMQNTDINFSPNAPKLDISEEKPKKVYLEDLFKMLDMVYMKVLVLL